MPAPPKFKTSKPPDEKITVNVSAIDLGRIDLLVQEGFYANRTELIRTAIRQYLTSHADVVRTVSEQKTLVIGIQDFSAADLEAVKSRGQMLDIKALGLVRFAADVTPALALATISSVAVLGALHASSEVKKALATRIAQAHRSPLSLGIILHKPFQDLMASATAMTRRGDLAEATALIQRALAGHALASAPPAPAAPDATSSSHDPDVIEGQVREVFPEGQAPAQPSQSSADQLLYGVFGTGAQQRRYRLFIPGRQPAQAMPLIVMLHGCTQDADDFARGTGMDAKAREHGFAVLYPEQSQRLNPQRCWNWFKRQHQQRDRGEPAALAELTRIISRQHTIGQKGIFVAGLSAGGAMAAVLGHVYPDLFDAVAVHSGIGVGAASDLASALNTMRKGPMADAQAFGAGLPRAIVIHGDRDPTVHASNADPIVDHCLSGRTPRPQPMISRGSSNGRDWTRTRYAGDDGPLLAERWSIAGLGHAWSGGQPSGSYTDVTGPDASELIVRFFLGGPDA
ncbi:MAG: PHB depolymerase family esterase [Burkholderiaceae bacterium]